MVGDSTGGRVIVVKVISVYSCELPTPADAVPAHPFFVLVGEGTSAKATGVEVSSLYNPVSGTVLLIVELISVGVKLVVIVAYVVRKLRDLVGKGCAEVEIKAVVLVFVPPPDKDIELALLAIHLYLHTKQYSSSQLLGFQ